MVSVEQIAINLQIPSTEVRIVAMQPFIQLQSQTQEPFRWSDGAVAGQLSAISRTLDIAEGGFEDLGANFTLFPEYAIPGIAGAAIIDERIFADTWPNGSIIIAGIHGIPKLEYRDLCDMLTAQVSQSNAPDSVPDDQWVNCCVIWTKDLNGVIQRWVQPKIRPAWSEMNVASKDMFHGSSVYIFECKYEPSGFPCRFLTLLCYDWVVSDAGVEVWREVLSQLNNDWDPDPAPLHWAFVLQHNPKPNSPAFLNNTYGFLTDRRAFPFVERELAVVVHANTAASAHPLRSGDGGFTACVFSPNAQFDCRSCRPTVCMQPKSLRGSDNLQRCHDVVFRESGECIHAFTVRVPKFVIPDATDRTYPLPSADVYPIGNSDDPRLSGGAIPAAVKWVGDSLDEIDRLSATSLSNSHLTTNAEDIEPGIISGMRSSSRQAAAEMVNWAACNISRGSVSRDADRRHNPDVWDAPETNAIKHVLHSLTSLGLAYNLEIENSLLHGTVEHDKGFIQVVAIRGDFYEDCQRHFDDFVQHSGTDPVLVIARDHDNNLPVPGDFMNIVDPKNKSGVVFIDYHTIVTNCRNAADSVVLKGILDEILPKYRQIL